MWAGTTHGDARTLNVAIGAAIPDVYSLQQVATRPTHRLLNPNTYAHPVKDSDAHECVVVALEVDADTVGVWVVPLRAMLGPVALCDPRLVNVELMPTCDEYSYLEKVKDVDF